MRFLSLLSTALLLGPALAHLPELPNRLKLLGADFLAVQQVYRGWAMLGFVVVALLSTLFLTIMVRNRPKAFAFTLIALLCIVGTQIVIWRHAYPAKQPTLNWTLLPAIWQELRQQWEYSHAASAVLNLMALGALILSALVKGSSRRVTRRSRAHARFLQNVVTFHSSWYEMALDEFREANGIKQDLHRDGLLRRSNGAKLSDPRRAAGDGSRLQGA